jgi:cell fate regulator YaaT (PSP1 superfamily)
MPQVVALKFAEGDFPTYYLPGPVADVKAQDFCVAPRNQSEQVGFVAAVEMWSARQTSPDHPLPSLSRRATPEEIERWWQQKAFERRAMVICKEKVLQHGLPIKISVAQFDEKAGKITFYFTSDKRVDFRALVRDLATILRCRIELWQIGAREEAQLLDGHGICGLADLLLSWLKNFQSRHPPQWPRIRILTCRPPNSLSNADACSAASPTNSRRISNWPPRRFRVERESAMRGARAWWWTAI